MNHIKFYGHFSCCTKCQLEEDVEIENLREKINNDVRLIFYPVPLKHVISPKANEKLLKKTKRVYVG